MCVVSSEVRWGQNINYNLIYGWLWDHVGAGDWSWDFYKDSAFNCYLSSQLRYTLLPVYMYSLFEYIHVVEDLENMVIYFYHFDELPIYFQSLNYFTIIPTKYDVSNSYIFFNHASHCLYFTFGSLFIVFYAMYNFCIIPCLIVIWVSFSLRLLLLCVWTMYLCVSIHMPQRASGGERKLLWIWSSASCQLNSDSQVSTQMLLHSQPFDTSKVFSFKA